jgi:hypothetical protein
LPEKCLVGPENVGFLREVGHSQSGFKPKFFANSVITGNLQGETGCAGLCAPPKLPSTTSLISHARSGEASLSHVYNGMDDRVSISTSLSGDGTDTRRFVYAPDGRVLGEYGASASDVKAEFIWMSPEVGDSGAFGGDDGLGGYMPLAVAVPTATAGSPTPAA